MQHVEGIKRAASEASRVAKEAGRAAGAGIGEAVAAASKRASSVSSALLGGKARDAAAREKRIAALMEERDAAVRRAEDKARAAGRDAPTPATGKCDRRARARARLRADEARLVRGWQRHARGDEAGPGASSGRATFSAFSSEGPALFERGLVAHASRALLLTLVWLVAVAQLSPHVEVGAADGARRDPRRALCRSGWARARRGRRPRARGRGARPCRRVAPPAPGAAPAGRLPLRGDAVGSGGALAWTAWLGRWSLVDAFALLLLAPALSASGHPQRLLRLPGAAYLVAALVAAQVAAQPLVRRNGHFADVLALRELSARCGVPTVARARGHPPRGHPRARRLRPGLRRATPTERPGISGFPRARKRPRLPPSDGADDEADGPPSASRRRHLVSAALLALLAFWWAALCAPCVRLADASPPRTLSVRDAVVWAWAAPSRLRAEAAEARAGYRRDDDGAAAGLFGALGQGLVPAGEETPGAPGARPPSAAAAAGADEGLDEGLGSLGGSGFAHRALAAFAALALVAAPAVQVAALVALGSACGSPARVPAERGAARPWLLAVAHHASALALHDVLLAAAAAVVWRSGTPWDDASPGGHDDGARVCRARGGRLRSAGDGAAARSGRARARGRAARRACGQALAAETARRDPPFFDAARGRIGAQRLPETGVRRAGAPARGLAAGTAPTTRPRRPTRHGPRTPTCATLDAASRAGSPTCPRTSRRVRGGQARWTSFFCPTVDLGNFEGVLGRSRGSADTFLKVAAFLVVCTRCRNPPPPL